MPTTLKSLIVLLDGAAAPFCYYSAPENGSAAARMPLETLQCALDFARQQGLAVLCVLGAAPLPAPYRAVLARYPHQKIIPFALRARWPGAIGVLDLRAAGGLLRRKWRMQNVILRVRRAELPRLAETFARLCARVKRLNVRLLELDAYTDSDLEEYRRQCAAMARTVAAMHWPKKGTECNLLTDRLVLDAMHNCGAGVEHLTAAPDGRFYLCPGFYGVSQAEALGTLADGPRIPNAHLLTLHGAPVCRACDAWHCSRCLWLNQRATGELNTPSRQQCVAAHLERDAAGKLRESLRAAGRRSAGNLSLVRPLDYLDPFEKVGRK